MWSRMRSPERPAFILLPLLLLLAAAALPASEMPIQANLVKSPGASLYVEVHGSAPGVPLVLANGGPGFDHTYLLSSSAWDTLAQRRRVVFYDQRGVGRSPALAEGQSCTLADQVADLEAVREHLGADRIDLAGLSWGGLLSMAYAARYPQHIAHLVLIDSAAPKWKDTVFLFQQVFPQEVEQQEAKAKAKGSDEDDFSPEGLHDYLAMIFYSPEKRDAFFAGAGGRIQTSAQVNHSISKDVEKVDLTPEIKKFHFPALVITGRYDMNVAPVTAYRIHQAIPGSKFAVFERSGHLPFYEEPEAFVRTIEGFLATP